MLVGDNSRSFISMDFRRTFLFVRSAVCMVVQAVGSRGIEKSFPIRMSTQLELCAIVTDHKAASCDFSSPVHSCSLRMTRVPKAAFEPSSICHKLGLWGDS